MWSAPGSGRTRGRLAKPPPGDRLAPERPAPETECSAWKCHTPSRSELAGQKLSRGPSTHRDPGSANRGARGVGTVQARGDDTMGASRNVPTTACAPPQACSPGAGTRGQGPLPSKHQAGGSVFVHLANPSMCGSCKAQPQGSSARGFGGSPWGVVIPTRTTGPSAPPHSGRGSPRGRSRFWIIPTCPWGSRGRAPASLHAFLVSQLSGHGEASPGAVGGGGSRTPPPGPSARPQLPALLVTLSCPQSPAPLGGLKKPPWGQGNAAAQAQPECESRLRLGCAGYQAGVGAASA